VQHRLLRYLTAIGVLGRSRKSPIGVMSIYFLPFDRYGESPDVIG
jgi:hypothetical protein